MLGIFFLFLQFDQAIRAHSADDFYPDVEYNSSTGIFYLAYEYARYTTEHDIIVSLKIPDGIWVDQGTFLYASQADNRRPSLAVDDNNVLYLVCEGPDPSPEVGNAPHWYISTDTAKNWETHYIPGEDWSNAYLPDICVLNDGTIYIVYEDRTQADNPDIRGYCITSGGVYNLEIAATADEESNPRIASNGNSAFVVYQHEGNIEGCKILGHSVSPSVTVSSLPGDEEISSVYFSGNDVYVGFTLYTGDQGCVYVAYSHDGGNSFEVSAVSGFECTTKNIAVTYANDTVFAAYYVEGGNIYMSISTDGGATWELLGRLSFKNTVVENEKIDIVHTGKEFLVVWVDERQGNLDIYGSSYAVGVKEKNEDGGLFKKVFYIDRYFLYKGCRSYSVDVFDVNGRKVLSCNGYGNICIDFSSYPAGMYFLVGKIDKKRINVTILKLKS